jgi:cell fate regulator YaaT (PSP1 superfamily)
MRTGRAGVNPEHPVPQGGAGKNPARPPLADEVKNVVGVRLHPTGRTIPFDAGELSLQTGERVVVDDRRGGAPVGLVMVASSRRPARGAIGRVLRRADPRDLERLAAEQERMRQALSFARERARERQLPVKFFRVEVGADKVLFLFSSEQRVDFRELVRDLAARFRSRIELRQVGVRDEAKLVGGIGTCGRELCCSTFLPHFAPVSIRMAKHQNLALTPTKVSGQCGRLKCCLVYEEAQYIEAGKLLPRVGKQIETPDGVGRVEDVEILAAKVRVSFPDRPPATYAAADLRPAAPPKGAATTPVNAGPAAPSVTLPNPADLTPNGPDHESDPVDEEPPSDVSTN